MKESNAIENLIAKRNKERFAMFLNANEITYPIGIDADFLPVPGRPFLLPPEDLEVELYDAQCCAPEDAGPEDMTGVTAHILSEEELRKFLQWYCGDSGIKMKIKFRLDGEYDDWGIETNLIHENEIEITLFK
jgi:hypothetical protein